MSSPALPTGRKKRLAGQSDIAASRVHAQIDAFLWRLKKAEAISIACSRKLYVGPPEEPTVGMTSENAWNVGRHPQT